MTANDVIDLYRQGFGFKAIAKRMGCTHKVPRRIIVQAGIPLRTGEETKALSPAYANRYNDSKRIAARWVKSALACCRKRWPKPKPTAEEIREAGRRYYHENGVKEKSRNRYQSDPQFRERDKWRSRLQKVIMRRTDGMAHWFGCETAAQLIEHIERQWQEGMSWDNYGRGHGKNAWHIDHEIPVKLFDLTDPAKAAHCWHYRNLQPLWVADNMKKGVKVLQQSELPIRVL